MTEYEQVFAKSVCNKLRHKIIDNVYCGIKDDVLRVHNVNIGHILIRK